MLTRMICLLALLIPGFLMAGGDVARGRTLSAPCTQCHNADGNSTNAIWPKLAGQHPEYLYKQMLDFKQGAAGPRNVPLMYPQVMNLSDADMQDLAAYFASQKITPEKAEADKIALGEKIYRDGNVQSGVTACMSCHHPAGKGNGPALYPHVAAQHATYLAQQLRNFKTGARVADKMTPIAKRLTEEEIDAVASYMSGLKLSPNEIAATAKSTDSVTKPSTEGSANPQE